MSKRYARARFLLLAPVVGLSGCMGLGFVARSAYDQFDKKPAEGIASAQSEAISNANGGAPGTPIAWSDAKSGLKGTLMLDQAAVAPEGCHEFQQTVILSGETLRGQAVACLQKDNRWKVVQDGVAGRK